MASDHGLAAIPFPAEDTPSRRGGHTFLQWEDTPSLPPGSGPGMSPLDQVCPPWQECPPLTRGADATPPPAEPPQEGGAPHSRANYTPWGTPLQEERGAQPVPRVRTPRVRRRPGEPPAHGDVRLPLLPSGPDGVRRLPLRRAWPPAHPRPRHQERGHPCPPRHLAIHGHRGIRPVDRVSQRGISYGIRGSISSRRRQIRRQIRVRIPPERIGKSPAFAPRNNRITDPSELWRGAILRIDGLPRRSSEIPGSLLR